MNNHDFGTPAWAVRVWLKETGLQYSGNTGSSGSCGSSTAHAELNFQGLNSFKPLHCGQQQTSFSFKPFHCGEQ